MKLLTPFELALIILIIIIIILVDQNNINTIEENHKIELKQKCDKGNKQ